MSKEQIEEANELVDLLTDIGYDWDSYISECQENEEKPQISYEDFHADAILKAGYRKQSENTVELPCKVGTTVYVIEPLWFGIWGEDEHKCRKCEHFYEGGMGDHPDCNLGENCCYQISENEADLRKLADWITPNGFTGKIAWGNTVFLTREEAEAKMKGGAE